MLANVAYKIVNDRDAAKDIVQDVFVKVWNRKTDLQPESVTSSYLYRSVVNTGLNYLEKNKRLHQLDSSLMEQFINNDILPDESITNQELLENINAAIDLLPPKCRTIFVLSRFEELKYKEIAEHLNISIKTVENQMGIALRRMREQLSPYLTKEFFTFIVAVGSFALLSNLPLLVNAIL